MRAYPLASTTWGEEEINAIHEVIQSGRFTMGGQVSTFEEEFAKYIGSKYAVMVNSGSSANLALLAAARYRSIPQLQPGDEVLVPAVSWSTTFYPVSQLGCRLKFSFQWEHPFREPMLCRARRLLDPIRHRHSYWHQVHHEFE